MLAKFVSRSSIQTCFPRCIAVRLNANEAVKNVEESEAISPKEIDVNAVSHSKKTEATPHVPRYYISPLLMNRERLQDVLKDVQIEKYDAAKSPDDREWSSQWPVQAPFNPYLVPLPIRMGWAQNNCVMPDKFANLELVKVQNFLHLTPPAIKKHCAKLKQFCTPFPEELKSDVACEKAYPVETHSVDYVFASSTPRTPRARVITKQIRLCNLVLNEHARIKMIKILGDERYDRNTDIATIKVERCPTQQQNKDFCDYVLTALYFESWKKEKWETREKMDDYDYYYWWENSVSHQNLKRALGGSLDEADAMKRGDVAAYRKAVTNIKQEPQPDKPGQITEDRISLLNNYKESVLALLNLKKLQ
ncbi:small ribosomal subunit protein mS35-like isoform X1 [Clavelina lepadiformis]|uniref:small ribosomal subunit protein mS35-like isoform X1 n=1 Tax=Clavelina lepadiformis TaxID=159417 RepID=UPI004042A6B3